VSLKSTMYSASRVSGHIWNNAKYYSTAGIPVALLLIVQYHTTTILQRFYVNCSKLWWINKSDHRDIYLNDGELVWVFVVVTWLYILPDWVNCSNGMIWVSLDSIFWCNFRSDGHMTLYITWLGRLFKWMIWVSIRQLFPWDFRSDGPHCLIG